MPADRAFLAPLRRFGRYLAAAPAMRPLRNAGLLLVGKGVQGLLSLISFAIAARALGVEAFGMLVLLQNFALTVAHFVTFASWQVVVRYGAEALERGDKTRFRRITGFAVILDLFAALLGIALILLTVGPAARLFEIPDEMIGTARLFGLVVAFMVGGNASLGVLQLFNRFDLLVIQNTVIQIVRVVGSVFFLITGGGLAEFLLVWFLGIAISRVVLARFALRELGRRGLGGLPEGSFRKVLSPVPGIWRFAVGTNLISTLKLIEAKVGLLIVGWLLGPAAAGLFRVAQQFAEVVTQPVNKILVPAIYPELTRLTASGNAAARRDMVLRPALIAGMVALLAFAFLVLAGKWLIVISVGEAFRSAYLLMILLTLAGLPAAATFSLEPLLISIGRVRATLVARSVATALYLGLLFGLLHWQGLEGAGVASILYSLFITAVLILLTRSSIRRAAD